MDTHRTFSLVEVLGVVVSKVLASKGTACIHITVPITKPLTSAFAMGTGTSLQTVMQFPSSMMPRDMPRPQRTPLEMFSKPV